jgi:glutamine phosphoribosylpyrophosphate amidotransferase
MTDVNEICRVMEATGLDWIAAAQAIEAIRQYEAEQYLAGLEKQYVADQASQR